MGKVTCSMSMSLDGFIAGPNDGPENPLGDNGEILHKWVYDLSSWREQHGLHGGKVNEDAKIIDESFKNTGAIIMGKRMFNNAEKYWGDDPPFQMPVFVLTQEKKEDLMKEGGTKFIFVNDGIKSALHQARDVANGKDISIAGGANVIQQYMNDGLIHELQIHMVPVLLGKGIQLFELIDNQIELETTRVIDSSAVTHLKYHIKI